MNQREPVRELRLSADLLVYVSDSGFVVIQQDIGDVSSVCLEAAQVPELLAALRVIGESAAAKQAAVFAVEEAEYRAAFGDSA